MNISPLDIVEENVLAYYKGLAHSLSGQFFEQEHLVWFSTGRRSLLRFNGVLRALVARESLSALTKPVLDYFFSKHLPFFWAEFPPGAAPGLREFLGSNGVSPLVRDIPAMQRSLKAVPAARLSDKVEITLVKTERDQVDWLEVLMEGFPEPEDAREDFRQYLKYTLTESPTAWRHFLARWRGERCAISTLLCTLQAGGIYHVVTLPAYRGRGLGKALTLAAMQAARQIGYSTAVLFATSDGYPLYQKLGFETVVTADLYAWNGRETQ